LCHWISDQLGALRIARTALTRPARPPCALKLIEGKVEVSGLEMKRPPKIAFLGVAVALDQLGNDAGRAFPMETPVIEILWASRDFQKTAEQADLRLEDGRVLLVGDTSEPTQKSAHTGWGQRLVAGETIRFD
jgi:hypothetical protein